MSRIDVTDEFPLLVTEVFALTTVGGVQHTERRCTMSMPGFSAQAALYRVSRIYRPASGLHSATAGVQPAMPFFGMNCSLNQDEAIGAIVDGLGSIPIVGGVLSGVATVIGRAICS